MSGRSASSKMLRVPNEILPQVKSLIELWRGPGDSTVLKSNLTQAIEATQHGRTLGQGLEGAILEQLQASMPLRVMLDHPGRVADVFDLGGETVRVVYGQAFQLSRPQVAALQSQIETLNRNSFDLPITLRVME